MKNLKLIISDVDGVLTDGTKFYDTSGNISSKIFNDSDILAIKKLKNVGIDVCLLSACEEVNKTFSNQKNIEFYYVPKDKNGKRNKLQVYKEILKTKNLTNDDAAYVGNDFADIPTLLEASTSFCPSDSYDEVKESSKIICEKGGGKGVLYEIYEKVVRARNEFLQIEKLKNSVNALRVFVYNVIENAGSGHPGMSLGSSPMAYMIFKHFLRFNPNDTQNINRDRFVLSAGHAGSLLYSLLHLFGFKNPTIEDLKEFRKLNSRTPAHPENTLLDGIEVTTGPLGQGFANAVGLAMASKHAMESLDISKDQKVYVLLGDGCVMEGISYEAAAIAGSLKLNNLIAVYDYNDVTIDGNVSLVSIENVPLRFQAAGWNVEIIENGDEGFLEMYGMLNKSLCSNKPTIIIYKTMIGYGLPDVQGTKNAHGSLVSKEKSKVFRKNLGFISKEIKWQGPDDAFVTHNKIKPASTKEFNSKISKEVLDSILELREKISTRDANKIIIKKLFETLPGLIGGSADLSESNGCYFGNESFNENFKNRYIHFGPREHAMAAITNGIARYSDYFIPFCATFACFSDYMKPAIRVAAISKAKSIFVLSHDSVDMGQDGPTHQPVEHATAYRAIPELNVYRPADAQELMGVWDCMLNSQVPSILFLGREKQSQVGDYSKVKNGAYSVFSSKHDNIAILSTGAEVELSINIAKVLKDKHGLSIRVISVPCLEIFEKQDDSYKQTLLPYQIKDIFAIEMLSGFEWYKHVKGKGIVISNNKFGHSAEWNEEYKKKMNFDMQYIIEIFESKLC